MNKKRILKLIILLFTTVLLAVSFFMYRFLFMNENPLLKSQVVPIPSIDIEAYQFLQERQQENSAEESSPDESSP